MPRELRRKLVVVGDQGVGKTCLLNVFAHGRFPEPPIFESFIVDRDVNGKHIELSLWDTAASPDFDRLRPLSYPGAHVVLLCFAVDSTESFTRVEEHWIKEIRHFLPRTPIVLVGTKVDLRLDAHVVNKLGRQLITTDEGSMLAQKIGALHYCETSAKQMLGVEDTFHLALQATIMEEKSNCCVVM